LGLPDWLDASKVFTTKQAGLFEAGIERVVSGPVSSHEASNNNGTSTTASCLLTGTSFHGGRVEAVIRHFLVFARLTRFVLMVKMIAIAATAANAAPIRATQSAHVTAGSSVFVLLQLSFVCQVTVRVDGEPLQVTGDEMGLTSNHIRRGRFAHVAVKQHSPCDCGVRFGPTGLHSAQICLVLRALALRRDSWSALTLTPTRFAFVLIWATFGPLQAVPTNATVERVMTNNRFMPPSLSPG
jgi:hypothetical protein